MHDAWKDFSSFNSDWEVIKAYLEFKSWIDKNYVKVNGLSDFIESFNSDFYSFYLGLPLMHLLNW